MAKQRANSLSALSNLLREPLVSWFLKNKRELPWRASKDAYHIWISEVMLQQTTTQAVIPYYEKFLRFFPTVQALASAEEKQVLEQWAGLGYYSRARNLHKASKVLAENGFAKSAEELLALPGFGPYTSRAVASLAFEEPVGVLDGNVIRILSRVTNTPWQWWQTKDRNQLQELADQLANTKISSNVNQAMMELGATICTPQSPSCFICPWNTECMARKSKTVETLPLKKPKGESHILQWDVVIYEKNKQIAFVENDYAPFLKKSPILPGAITRLNKRPVQFDLKHSITKYEIYAKIKKIPHHQIKKNQLGSVRWLELPKITQEIPYSLITKTLQQAGLSLEPQSKRVKT